MRKIILIVLILISNVVYLQNSDQKIIITYNNCSKVIISNSSDSNIFLENFIFTWGNKTDYKKLKAYKDKNGFWKLNIKIKASTNFNKLNFTYKKTINDVSLKISKNELFSQNNLIIHSNDFPFYDESLFLILKENKEVYLVNLDEYLDNSYIIKKVEKID